MKTAVLAFAAILAGPRLASAGTYFGLAVGPGIETSGDSSYTSSDRTGKILAGYSFGQIAIEGGAQRGSLTQDGSNVGFDVTQLSLTGKYSLPLSDGFEVFGRAGLQRTTLGAQDSSFGGSYDSTGTGIILGGGIEYRLKLVATQASIFVDYTFASTSLQNDQVTSAAPQSLQTRGFSLGATIGF